MKAATSKQPIKARILKRSFCHLAHFFLLLLLLIPAERDSEHQRDDVVKGDRGQMRDVEQELGVLLRARVQRQDER